MNTEFIVHLKCILKGVLHYSSNIQALTISVGVIVGGFWTYLLFVKQRLNYPKITPEMEINAIDLENARRLIHVEIKLANVGSTLFRANYAELRLRQILPIEDNELLRAINQGLDPVQTDRTNIEWPCFTLREWRKEFEIEPGEPDTLHADFVIGKNIECAEFYFYLKNNRKKKNIGWTVTKTYKFRQEGILMPDKSFHQDQQERQQSQEKKQQQQQPKQTPQQKPSEGNTEK